MNSSEDEADFLPESQQHNFSGNSTDEEQFFIPFYLRPETYIVPVLFAAIFIVGILGNGTLIAIFIKNRSTRNVPNMYICSLAIGDILLILFCVPFTSTVYTVESWPYGEPVCKLSEFIKDVSVGVSVFTLTALSADRYFAIAQPMRKLNGMRATKITWIAIIGIWIISIIFALPSAVFSYVRVMEIEPDDKFLVCYPFPPQYESYPQMMVLFKFLVYYAIPLAFISVFYYCMAKHLVQSTKLMPGEAQGQGQANNKQIQARKKVAKMVLTIVAIFAMCFLPSHVFLMWFYYFPEAEYNYNVYWHALRIIGFCLAFINSCINPITLYCVSGTFRKHFNQNLFCCVCKVNNRSRSGRSRRIPGINCGCVSISNTEAIYGHRNPSGSIRSNNGHGTYRSSCGTKFGPKRKQTWETQTTGTTGTNSIRSAVTTVLVVPDDSRSINKTLLKNGTNRKRYGSLKQCKNQQTSASTNLRMKAVGRELV